MCTYYFKSIASESGRKEIFLSKKCWAPCIKKIPIMLHGKVDSMQIKDQILLYKRISFKIALLTSGQDGSMGRYTLSPCIPKIRTTTNLKTKNNQNFQKIKLYGSPTIKELEKKHSSRLVGGAETGRLEWRERQGGGWKTRWARQQLADWWSHIHIRINWE